VIDDDTPIQDVIFEMEINLCEKFTSLTPFSVRREKAREVFAVVRKYALLSKKKDKKSKQKKSKIIRRPARDTWF